MLEMITLSNLKFLVASLLTSPILLVYMIQVLIRRLLADPWTFFHLGHSPTPEPETLTDPRWGKSCFIEANGIQFHYVTKGSGNLMLCLHGWPEFWYSWRHQLEEFGEDHMVVAVDIRGFNKSDKPKGREAYTMAVLLADIEALVTALGHTTCILLGHDWGAVVAWEFARYKPSMLEKVVIMSVPHPETYTLRDYMGLSHVALFMCPRLPELLFRIADYQLLRAVLGKSAGGAGFSLQDVEAYVHAMSQPGALTGGFSYYRYVFGGRQSALLKATRMAHPTITVPVMVLQGEKDTLFTREAFHNTAVFCSDYTLFFVPDADHWVLQQQPEVVNRHIRNYLKKGQ